MNRRETTSGGAARALWGGLLLGAMALGGGCDKMPWAEGEAEEAEGEGGPCEKYASRICDKAGERSQTCSSIKSATEIMPPASCEAALADVKYSLKKLGDKQAKCDELIDKLCKELGEDSETCAMVTEQTKAFPPQRCEMMLQHFDKVLADLQKRAAANKPLPPEKMAELVQGENVPAFGPEGAKVTIVEFSDFQCPYCSKAAKVAEKVREEYGDKVRFVFRQYPLPMHPQARLAAQAALAAEAQGKFWEYHDKLFANQRQLGRKALEKYAKELGLDMEQFNAALDEKKYAKQIETDMKLGQGVSVRGTPTMFINGKKVSNPTSYETVSKAIEKNLEG